MRIIVANYRFFVAGGPEKYMFKFMEAAVRRGHEVIPFSVENPMNEPTEYAWYFAKPRAKQLMYQDTKKSIRNIWGVVRATTWNNQAARKLKKLIKDTKPDVVYILHEINHLSPSIIHAAKKMGVKVVHRISDFFMFCARYDFLCDNEVCEACLHGNYERAKQKRCVKGSKWGTLIRLWAMRLYWKRHVFDEVDKYICTCQFSKKKLIEGGIPTEKIECVPTFINANIIEPCYLHKKYFLLLGRVSEQKGIIYAIEAMKYLKDTGYKLLVTGKLGNNSYDQSLQHCIENNHLAGIVEFVGFQTGEALQDLIQNASCVLSPAIWYENMPNAVIESYAYGKPVIASRIGSLADMIDNDVTGFLFEPKNIKAMSVCMKRYIENEELLVQHGRNARRKCELEYSEENHMNKLMAEFL